MTVLPQLLNRFRRSARVVCEPAAVWRAVGAFALIILGIIALLGAPADRIRLGGLALDIVGLALVYGEIRATRRLFGKPSMWRGFGGWLLQIKGAFRKPVTVDVSVNLGGVSLSAMVSSPTLSVHVPTLESRVADLERALTAHRATTANELAAVRKKADEHHRLINEHREEAKARHAKLNQTLEAYAAGDLHMTTIGLAFVALGSVCGNASGEIADVLRWLIG
jgi:hypothetical protein